MRLYLMAWICLACSSFTLFSAEPTLLSFKTQQLATEYYSEGAGAGDLNNDGAVDIVYGPHWYAGPGFTEKHEIYAPKPQDREKYADHFFVWVHDFDQDGWRDLFVVGFPGTPAYVYQNPGKAGDKHWAKHQVFDWVSNESPQLINLVGDETPELVCTRDGFFGYATIDKSKPLSAWKFNAVSEQVTDKKFGHGLGVGDVNGDGLADIIHSKGWFEQPKDLASAGGRWTSHEAAFTNAYGGAEIYAYDVDGDGDQDIITSLAAHDFGLAWYEQTGKGDSRQFVRHDIMGSKPIENKYGLAISELHSVNLFDMDGDGLKDIVTGKTYYSHHKQSPGWDAGAVVVWFKLVRSQDGVDWVPQRAADDTGVGRQLGIFDINQDKLPDIVVGGMKGCAVITQSRKSVDQATWQKAQPVVYQPTPAEKAEQARVVEKKKPLAERRAGAIIEGEKLKVSKVSRGSAAPQGMGGFAADKWSGDSQLWWTGARPGDKLIAELPVEKAGKFDLLVVLTKARDYAIVQVWLDDKKLGGPIDLYNNPEVITTGLVNLGNQELSAGTHQLTFEITGANPAAAKQFMVGIDAVQLGLAAGQLPKGSDGAQLNLDFESGKLNDWVATGDAFKGQPVEGDKVVKRRQDMQSQHNGKYWIGTYEVNGDEPKGTLTSSAFKLDMPYASFLIGGGETPETRVELVDKASGNALAKFSGRNSENMRTVIVDLKAHVGKEIFVRVVDNSSGGWGHINFDHFQLHADQPGPISQNDNPLVADEYPFKGQAAGPAAANMKVPAGFRVIPAAAEPDVKQPIAMALDDRGRVWIAEAYEYPRRAEGDKGRDRVLIFEDTNGDGTLDSRKVFAEGLNLISGLEVGFGGVWIGAAPYLMFLADANGDDVADGEPKVLLDGWGLQDTHETLNTFIWGPDGWLYGCHGVFTHSRVGKPGTPDEQRIPINAGIWRYHPTQHRFEVFAHGTSNPWGVDFNDRGQAFLTACVIPHLYHVIQGGRYERQAGNHFNPYTYNDIKTIADHFHYLGAKPHSGNGRSDAAGGGHAHAGAMIYLGNAWPAEYRDKLFMNNIHGQRLNMDVPKPKGSGYVGSHGPDFLLTGDQASQILNLRYGPDGQCWMIDWYDMQACHLTEVGRHDRTNGRIYKIAYGENKPVTVDLSKASDDQLAGYATHENDWYVRHSRKVLQERAAKGSIANSAIEQLNKIALSHAEDTKRLRAAWALAAIGKLNVATRDKMLADASPYVRGWAIQLSLDATADKALAVNLTKQLVALAEKDDSPVTRLYLASAAGRLPVEERWDLLKSLASHASDAEDHNLPLMIWYAAEPLAEVDPARALTFGIDAGKQMPILREYMLRRIGSRGDQSAVTTLVAGLDRATEPSLQLAFLDAIRTSLTGQRRVSPPDAWPVVSKKLNESSDAKVRLQAETLGVTFGDEAALAKVRVRIADTAAPIETRRESLASLLAAKDAKLGNVLQQLLAEPAMREQALAGLAQVNDPKTAEVVLARYSELNPSEKRTALATLSARSDSALAMLQAVAAKKIPSSDLSADLVRQLQNLSNSQVTELLGKTWGTVRETAADKAKLIEDYKKLVASSKAKPDLGHGRAVYMRTCQQCHQLFGVGGKVGPDLTGSNRTNIDYLLSNIVDPSAVMAKEYQPTIVLTSDSRVITGIVREEDDKSLKIQTATALEVVPKDEVESRKLSNQSMMPDDQLKQFTPAEVLALLAYLSAPAQVPVLADEKNASTFFNGRDLTGWQGNAELWSVENGELVGRSQGLKKNEFLISEMAAANFKLSFEVKLVGNAGNSGVQFRSAPEEHGVKGYQADIGEGWWGKLYEEEGRGLLWPKSGEEHVKKNEWNKYEIVADGRQIKTYINGQLCVDLDDAPGARRGIFALQLHSGGPTEVRFRNFKLEP